MQFALRATLLMALVLVPTAALAQPDGRPATPVQNLQQAEARTHFQAGARHYQDGNFAQSIDEFRTAYRLFPSAVILFNLAQAYRGDGRLSESISTFRQFLAESPRIGDDQRRDVEGLITEIEANRCVLSFEVEPAGATLRLDGRAVGTLPLPRAVELLPGEHQIDIRLENYVTRTDSITLRAHERRLYTATLRLEERNARLTATVEPANAVLSLDGVEQGTGRFSERIVPGEHTVSASLEGFLPRSQQVRVASLHTETVALSLPRRGRAIYTRPIFWAIVGGVVLAGITAWIVTHPADATPIAGNATPSVVQSVLSW